MKSADITEARFNPYELHNPATTRSRNVPKMKTAEKVAEFINTHCSDIVSAYKNSNHEYLLRGMRTFDPVIYTNIRQDRRSIEMPKDIHDTLHKAYLGLGLTATRTNSIFCSTKYSVADSWGNAVMLVFPTNGWSGTVFESISTDYSYYTVYDIGAAYLQNIKRGIDQEKAYEKMLDNLADLEPIKITSAAELVPFLKQRYEDILITGQSYVGLEYSSSMTPIILEMLGLPIQS